MTEEQIAALQAELTAALAAVARVRTVCDEWVVPGFQDARDIPKELILRALDGD